jgi:hypothetical protein
MKKIYLLFPVCFFLQCRNRYYYDCSAQACIALKNEIIRSSLKYSDSVNAIPKKVFSRLRNKELLGMVEPGHDFNTTDIPVLPNKRLIFNGLDEFKKIGFIYFEKGGIGITYTLIVYSIKNKKINMCKMFFYSKFNDIKGVVQNISNGYCDCVPIYR